jgi:putrescine transport system ATP-binding protein
MDQRENRPLTPAFVELEGLSRFFGDVAAVRELDLRVRRGEIFAILGSSGCGKSTLLRIMAGLEAPDAGSVRVEGQDITALPPYRRPVNMMFQSYALFPHMSVEQNIAFGLKQDRLAAAEMKKRIDEVLALVQMSDFRRRRPAQLSGGQQQRVALARSLAKRPKLLLLDEPMGALDRKLRAEMQFELADIIRRVRVTCVIVTHDQDEAMVMADRLALMHEGRVVQIGKPAEVYAQPNSRFSAGFLGQVNLFEARVLSSAEGSCLLETPEFGGNVKAPDARGLNAGTAVSLAVRPEQVILSERPLDERYNAAGASVEDIGFLGSQTSYHLRLASGRVLTALVASAAAPTGLGHGSDIYLGWSVADGVVMVEPE